MSDTSTNSEFSEGVLPEGSGHKPTIEDRIARGAAANRIVTDEIIPFPSGWGDDLADLDDIRRGDARKEIYNRINEGWSTYLQPYRGSDGRVIYITLRQDHPTEKKKKVLPLRVERMLGIRPDVIVRGLSEPRPLLGLDQFAVRPQAPILFVEGEKAAEAAQRRFPDHVATTWPNGANGIGAVDLRSAIGRDAVIWPDNDNPGRAAAKELGAALLAIGAASVRVVDVPSWFPEKWDLADPLPEGGHGR